MAKHVSDDDEEVHDLKTKLLRFLPTQPQDMVAMFAFVFMMPVGFLVELLFVLPSFYTVGSSEYLWRAVPACFLAVNVFLNWVFLIRVGPNGRSPVLPKVVQSGFRYCHSCHLNAPPRAYHCPVCDSCAFRRDHHCSFAGVCVGHFNQRYFVAAIVNLWILTIPIIAWNWEWMWGKLGGFSVVQVWQLLLPHLALVFRFISLHDFFCVMVFVSSTTTFLFTTYLLAAQIFCIRRGQTRVEYLLDVHAYQLGFRENLRQALGERWPLSFFSPFIPCPLPSNGMHFETREIAHYPNPKLL